MPVAEQAQERREAVKPMEPLSLRQAPAPIFATLLCGHDILWDDPDEDVNGSFYCPKCEGYFRVDSFSGGAA